MTLRALGVLALTLSGCALPWSSTDSREDTPPASVREMLESTPVDPPAATFPELMRQADQSRDAGDLPRAAWKYLRALRMEPASALPGERIGMLMLSEGSYERAQGMLAEVVANHPDSMMGHCGLGLALMQRGELDRAESHLRRAQALAPESILVLLSLGVLNDRRSAHDVAAQYYQRGLALAPNSPDLHNNLGLSLLLRQENAAAIEHLRLAAELDPDDRVGRNNLGIALGRAGRYEEALAAFRRASSEAWAQNNVGYLYFLNGDYESALRHFELALMETEEGKLPIIQNIRRAELALSSAGSEPSSGETEVAPSATE